MKSQERVIFWTTRLGAGCSPGAEIIERWRVVEAGIAVEAIGPVGRGWVGIEKWPPIAIRGNISAIFIWPPLSQDDMRTWQIDRSGAQVRRGHYPPRPPNHCPRKDGTSDNEAMNVHASIPPIKLEESIT